jgi:hypothetical protein
METTPLKNNKKFPNEFSERFKKEQRKKRFFVCGGRKKNKEGWGGELGALGRRR